MVDATQLQKNVELFKMICRFEDACVLHGQLLAMDAGRALREVHALNAKRDEIFNVLFPEAK